jgi:K+-sensing histidine kinase KdpD
VYGIFPSGGSTISDVRLWICLGVEAHGGIVRAESEHTRWTRFTVELPIPNEEELKNADAA